MRNFAILLKFQFKYKLGIARVKDAFSVVKNNKISSLVIALLLCSVCACVLIPYGVIMSAIYDIFTAAGNIEGYFSTVTVMANIMVFVLAIFSVFGIMFADKDREILAPLPIKKQHIFLANYVIMYVAALLSACLFLFPGYIVFFVKNGFSLLLCVKMVLGTLVFPVMPLAVAFVVISVISRIVSGFKFKEALLTVFGALIICASLIFTNNNEILSGLLTKTHTFNRYLLNSHFLSKALASASFDSFVFLLNSFIFALIILFAVYVCGGFVYDSITEKMNSVSKSEKTAFKFSHKKQHNAFCSKEIKTILRSPIFALNCLVNIVIAPVAAYMITKRLPQLSLKSFGEFETAMIGLFVSFAIMSMGLVSSTSISREGKCFWITQIVPVSLKKQAKGRIKAATIFYFIAGEIFLFLFGVLLKIDFLYIIYGLVLTPVGALPFSYLGLFVDLIKPKLYWDKESEAVKQNFNGMLGIFACMLLTVVYMLPFILYMLGFVSKMLSLITVPIMIIVCLLLTRYMLYKRIGDN